MLKADWTSKDPAITRALAGFGRSGVPLYVLYETGPAAQPRLLPEHLRPPIPSNRPSPVRWLTRPPLPRPSPLPLRTRSRRAASPAAGDSEPHDSFERIFDSEVIPPFAANHQ